MSSGCGLESLATDENSAAPADPSRLWRDRPLDFRYDHGDVYDRGMIQRMPSKKKSVDATNNAFQLKIRLLGMEPEIWRRVIVPSALTLRELHAVIDRKSTRLNSSP